MPPVQIHDAVQSAETKAMAKEKILVVDDEEDILELVRYNLSQEGYEVVCRDTGEGALELLKSTPVDLILLDLMLPGINGFTVANRLKGDERLNRIPIVMLTARGEESDVVAGLEIGAEDYITKPFSPRILIARVRAILRRQGESPDNKGKIITVGKLRIDALKHIVSIDDEPINLTFTEFEVLAVLAGRQGWAFSRTQIVDAVRGYNYSVTDRSVDVQIVGLRRKLGSYGSYIETVRGVGYRFRDH
jgi:two-component system, OmpR family, alkaline phosphatase synthesis response regulator PhoP